MLRGLKLKRRRLVDWYRDATLRRITTPSSMQANGFGVHCSTVVICGERSTPLLLVFEKIFLADEKDLRTFFGGTLKLKLFPL